MKINEVIKSLPASNAAVKNTASSEPKDGWYPAYSASGQDVWLPEYRYDKKGIVVSAVGARCGKAFKADGKWNICANTHPLIVDESKALRDYCWYMVNNEKWWIKGGTAQPFVKVKDSFDREHNFPTLEEQKIIVNQLNAAQRLIELKKLQVKALDNLIKARFVEMFGDPKVNPKQYQIKKISELFDVGSSKRVFESQWTKSGVPFYRAREIVKLSKDGYVDNELFIDEAMYEEYKTKYGVPKANDMMVTGVGTLGTCYIVKDSDKFYFKDGNTLWFKNKGICDVRFIRDQYGTDFIKDQITKNANASTVGTYTISNAKDTLVLVPPLDEQLQYVSFCKRVDKSKFAKPHPNHKNHIKL